MDIRRVDLHMHSNRSDGRLSPSELVRTARQHGIHAMALTDHDVIDGYREAVIAGRLVGVEVVSGVELSVEVGGMEIHLLGYFFDTENAALSETLVARQADRKERAVQIVERLNDLGIPLDFGSIAARAGEGAVGRPHIAAAMVEGGYVPGHEEAFARYLRDGGEAYVPFAPFAAGDALALLRRAGGIGVLAHPGPWMPDEVILQLIRLGVDGIETTHPSVSPGQKVYYRELARRHGLLETGGSDYHGFNPADELRLGRYSIPYARLAEMRGH